MHSQVDLCSGHHLKTAARSRAEVLVQKLLDVAASIYCRTRLFDEINLNNALNVFRKKKKAIDGG